MRTLVEYLKEKNWDNEYIVDVITSMYFRVQSGDDPILVLSSEDIPNPFDEDDVIDDSEIGLFIKTIIDGAMVDEIRKELLV